MKKNYDAPILELLAYCSASTIGADWQDEVESGGGVGSKPWNDGELGWT